MAAALVFLCAFGLSLGLTPLVRRLALRLGVVDNPEKRKMHHVPVPLLGGAAVVVSSLVVLTGVWILAPEFLGEDAPKLPAMLLAGTIIAALGVYDDWRGARASVKLVWQSIAAAVVVMAGVQTGLFTNPLGGSLEVGWLGIPVTILWIVGVTNAMNLIDGLDGLAAGIGAIAALSLCSVAAMMDNFLVAIVSLTLAGASLGFLPFNLYPARIFLGDTGSMFLGFILSSVGAVGSLKASASTVLVLPLIVLGVPVFDTVWAVLRRTHRRVSPFKPDREHIHHRLVRVGLHHRHVVLVLYFVCAFLGLSAVIMVQLPYQTGFLFAALLVLGGAMGVWTLKFIDEHLERSAGQFATANGVGATAAGATSNGRSRASGLLRKVSDPGEVEVVACAVGRFRAGAAASVSAFVSADAICEALRRRLSVYEVGLFMNEDRDLIVVLRIQPLGPEGRALVRGALERLFRDAAGSLGDSDDFPKFRWLRLSEEGLRGVVGIPGAAAL